MDIKPRELVKETGGKALGNLLTEYPVNRICTDTRLIEENDVFFAFAGQRFDGHEFVAAALEKGAKHFVVSDAKKASAALEKRVNVILVKDTVRAYGDLARFWRRRFKIPAVAVTGSVGKTTVKELTAHLLSAKFKTLKNRGTENNLIGVPKTIFQLDPSHERLVLEMGTNYPGEIERLSRIAGGDIGILTQISPSHLEGLKDLKGVKKEKLGILKGLRRGGTLLLNGEDPSLKEVHAGLHKVRRVGFTKKGNALFAEGILAHEEGTSFTAGGVRYETRLVGRHNIVNCLLALECAKMLGVGELLLKKALASFEPVPGRLCLKKIDGVTFLDDSYNSNPGSFRAALETLESFRVSGKKGVLCGDMLELGSSSEAYHRELGAFAAGQPFDFIVACGPQSKFLVEEALKEGYHQSKIFHAKDSAEGAKICQKLASAGDMVLVKGSRGMQMEKIFECCTSYSTR